MNMLGCTGEGRAQSSPHPQRPEAEAAALPARRAPVARSLELPAALPAVARRHPHRPSGNREPSQEGAWAARRNPPPPPGSQMKGSELGDGGQTGLVNGSVLKQGRRGRKCTQLKGGWWAAEQGWQCAVLSCIFKIQTTRFPEY